MPGRDYTEAYVRFERALHNVPVSEDYDTRSHKSNHSDEHSSKKARSYVSNVVATDNIAPYSRPFFTFGLNALDRAALPPTPPSHVRLNEWDCRSGSVQDFREPLIGGQDLSPSSLIPLTPDFTPPATSNGLISHHPLLQTRESISGESFETAREDQGSHLDEESRLELPLELDHIDVPPHPDGLRNFGWGIGEDEIKAHASNESLPPLASPPSLARSFMPPLVLKSATNHVCPVMLPASKPAHQSGKSILEPAFQPILAAERAQSSWYRDDSVEHLQSTNNAYSSPGSVVPNAIRETHHSQNVGRTLSETSNCSTVVQASFKHVTLQRKRTIRRVSNNSELRKASISDENTSRGSWYLSEPESPETIVDGKHSSPLTKQPDMRDGSPSVSPQSLTRLLSSKIEQNETHTEPPRTRAMPDGSISSTPRAQRARRLSKFGQRVVSEPLKYDKIYSPIHHTDAEKAVSSKFRRRATQPDPLRAAMTSAAPYSERQNNGFEKRPVTPMQSPVELKHLSMPSSIERLNLFTETVPRNSAALFSDPHRESLLGMASSPFSMRSELEVNEAKAINIYPHNNKSVVVVQHTPSAVSRAKSSSISPSYFQRPAQVTPPKETTTVDSPLQNPRKPPPPPSLAILPPTPFRESEIKSPQKKLSIRDKARRYSDSIILPILALKRSSSDIARQQSTREHYVQNQHHESNNIETTPQPDSLHPSWQPRSSYNEFSDSDGDLLSARHLTNRPHSMGNLIENRELSPQQGSDVRRRSTLKAFRNFAIGNKKSTSKPARESVSPMSIPSERSAMEATFKVPENSHQMHRTQALLMPRNNSESLFWGFRNKIHERSGRREDSRRQKQRNKLRSSIGTRLFHESGVRASVD